MPSNNKTLVLSRKSNESLVMFMGDVEIKVTVFEVSGGKAKLAISAPEEVKIYRSELVEEE